MKRTRSVKDVMSPDVITVAAEMTTDELARYLTEREISGAPVVDSEGHLVGVVSMTDIGRHLAEPFEFESSRSPESCRRSAGELTLEEFGQRYDEPLAVTVRDVMTPAIYQVPATATVAEAARVMIREQVHRLVVTQGREPVGIITSMDVLRVVAEPS